MSVSHNPARLDVMFDDDHAVANAGLALTSILAGSLGIEALADEMVDLGDRPGGAHPGRKVMTLVHSVVVGGDCIDDTDVLRSGSTEVVLGHQVMAPSTCGTLLRSFSFGHVRQLDRLCEAVLTRAWQAGAGPGQGAMTVDVDSTVCEVHGRAKQGAAYGYTRRLGYHPMLATRADTGEVLHTRMRTGSANTARGAERFVNELVPRLRRAGASGEVTLRAVSGFWSKAVITACYRHEVRFSITVRLNDHVKAAIADIDEEDWADIDYTGGGVAQVGEGTPRQRAPHRAPHPPGPQAKLWPDWRYHAFVTNRAGHGEDLEAHHRHHAICELAIRDLKEGAGLNHCPSGHFNANAAWLVLAALAHNLIRWVAAIGVGLGGTVVAKTLRRRLITLPGRITRSARRRRLHLPRRWPWRRGFMKAVVRLRSLPALA